MKKTILFCITLMLVFFLVSCENSANNVYNIAFYVEDEIYLTQHVKKNKLVEDVKAPLKEYYSFKGWYDKETNEEYDFSTPTTKNIELIAEYEKITNLAGGDYGKIYNFSDLTYVHSLEITQKLEQFLIDHAVYIPIANSAKMYMFNDRITLPVSKYNNYAGFAQLYSSYEGESVFRQQVSDTFENENGQLLNLHNDLVYMGLYTYKYNDEYTSYELLPYFANSDPIKLDDEGYIWKVYLTEGFKYSNGTDVLFNDFVESYERTLTENADNFWYISNATAYGEGKCEREDVGISYSEEEKSITFTMRYYYSIEKMKDILSDAAYGPIHYEHPTPETDLSTRKYVGEYYLKSITEEKVTFEKNPYFNYKNSSERTYEQIEAYLVNDSDKALEMFYNDELDMIEVKNYIEDPRWIDGEYYSDIGIIINQYEHIVKHPILLNENFRKSLYYGISRKDICDNNLNGYLPWQYFTSPNKYINNELNIKYFQPFDQTYAYDPEYALECYVAALKELILQEKLPLEEEHIIEIEVCAYISKLGYLEPICNAYEELLNSQTQYSNIKIKFNIVSNLTSYEISYKLSHWDFDLFLYEGTTWLNTLNAADRLDQWGMDWRSGTSSLYQNLYHSIAAEDYLIEFMGEMYTFEALSNALLKSRILIKNGKVDKYEYELE